MPYGPLALASGLSLGDYLAWNWSLAHGHQTLALLAGVTLPVALLALAWLVVVSLMRFSAGYLRRSSAPGRFAGYARRRLGRGALTGYTRRRSPSRLFVGYAHRRGLPRLLAGYRFRSHLSTGSGKTGRGGMARGRLMHVKAHRKASVADTLEDGQTSSSDRLAA